MNKYFIAVESIFLIFFLTAGGFAAPIKVTPSTVIMPTKDTADNQGPTSPDRVKPGEPPTRKSYLIPALEIPAFIILLNRLDLLFYGPGEYDVSNYSIRDHVNKGPWVVDQDAFTMNQIGHPYSGALYYGFARSAGLNYWESLIYSNAGAFAWEVGGETTDPSLNDQVASGTAGSFVGEVLYRLSNLIIENGGGHPAAWRKFMAGLVYPPTELNRLVFGKRYGPVLTSRDPAIFYRLQAGTGSNVDLNVIGNHTTLVNTVSYADFKIVYGLPGKPGYSYNRPFDYFDFEIDSRIEKTSQYNSAMIRGLLFGALYESGDNYRGIWGLYGTFDYLAPQVYRLSSTAGSFGTTGQWWVSKKVALQATGLIGLGFGGAGTILPDSSETDFHYGVTPQQLVALRLIMGKSVMIDASGHNYFITDIIASRAPGEERIQYLSTSLAVRVFGRHALSIGYLLASRNARYSSSLPGRDQLVRTITLTYNFLSHTDFGAVEWRDNMPEE
ncbi:MAG: DUF3943 domain-containing protein [Elusimicrobia bacterium]|nr:DUF3943 domain-containing protein [Candidatus Liberimonas magnetica]